MLRSAESSGKHLLVDFGEDDWVHVHLGLYGKFAVWTAAEEVPDPVGAVRLRLVADGADGSEQGTAYADLRGATQCALITPPEREAVLARIGPDPLKPDADPDRAWERVRRSRSPVGALLMDQSVLAGVGNVYRAEGQGRQRRHPLRPGTPCGSRSGARSGGPRRADAAGCAAGRIETLRPDTGRSPGEARPAADRAA